MFKDTPGLPHSIPCRGGPFSVLSRSPVLLPPAMAPSTDAPNSGTAPVSLPPGLGAVPGMQEVVARERKGALPKDRPLVRHFTASCCLGRDHCPYFTGKELKLRECESLAQGQKAGHNQIGLEL